MYLDLLWNTIWSYCTLNFFFLLFSIAPFISNEKYSVVGEKKPSRVSILVSFKMVEVSGNHTRYCRNINYNFNILFSSLQGKKNSVQKCDIEPAAVFFLSHANELPNNRVKCTVNTVPLIRNCSYFSCFSIWLDAEPKSVALKWTICFVLHIIQFTEFGSTCANGVLLIVKQSTPKLLANRYMCKILPNVHEIQMDINFTRCN